VNVKNSIFIHAVTEDHITIHIGCAPYKMHWSTSSIEDQLANISKQVEVNRLI